MGQTGKKTSPIPPAGVPLTPRERFARALRGQAAGRVPAWMMRQAGRYLPQYHEVRSRYDFLTLCKTPGAAAEVTVQPLEVIGTEALVIFNDILVPLEHLGAEVIFDERGPLIANPVAGGAALAVLAGREVSEGEPVAETIREVRRRVGGDYPILGFIGSPWTLATYWVEGRVSKQFERIGALRFRDPEFLDTLLGRITEVAADYLALQIRAGADAVQIFDTWGSILSAPEYERFSGRWIRAIIEKVKPLGAPVIVYVNGCAPYLDQLGGLGADCVSIDWRTELGEARRVLGPDVALQGNLDPRVLLAGPEAAEAAVRELFERFAPGPGHVFNLGHGVLPPTPVESARRLMEAVKRYGAY